jgi:hypothetical protein
VLDVTPGLAPHADIVAAPDRREPATAKVSVDTVLPGLPATMIAVVDTPNAPAPARGVAPEPSSAGAPPPVPPLSAGAGVPSIVGSPMAGLPVAEPMSIAASLQASPGQPPGLLLPFDKDVGAASFQRGHRLVIVFDSQKPIDLSSVTADPRFGQARFVLLASGAMLDIPCETACPMRLRRVADGWLLTPGDTTSDRLDPETVVDGLVFPFGQPGRAVVVADTESGADNGSRFDATCGYVVAHAELQDRPIPAWPRGGTDRGSDRASAGADRFSADRSIPSGIAARRVDSGEFLA